jgi:hypothetical protein
MSNYSSLKPHGSILAAAVMLAIAGTSQAQDTPARVTVQLASGLVGTVYASVPEGFEPDFATDQELFDNGFPPRPDVNNASAMALWRKAVHATRVPTDLVEQPGRYHRPVQGLSKPQSIANGTATSGNWSAVVLSGTSADFVQIVGFWAVPNVASQKAGTANGYSSMWVGLDGDPTSDLIQNGTASDWINGKAVYNAWVEVLPASEVLVPGLKVLPGDGIYAQTLYKVVNGKAAAYFYFTNFNTGKSVSTSIAFPTNLKFTGQSAEWVVERTEISGSFENPMPDYGLAFMSAAYAVRASAPNTLYPPNATPTSVAATTYVSMVDGSTVLSAPEEQGGNSIIFEWQNY